MKKFGLLGFLLFAIFVFSQNKNVFEVARNGTLEEMKILVAKNSDTINVVDKMSFSPLILACYRGNTEVAAYLIDQVKDIDYASSEGTALSALCMNYNKDLVVQILEKGADANYEDSHGYTPLKYAVMKGNIELAKILLTYGAKKQYIDNTGTALFEYAIRIGNPEMINLIKQ